MQSKALMKYRLLLETALLVLGVVGIKLIIEKFSLEFINLSPLFTSVIAGGIFIISIILSGTIADYKESEKLPTEISSAVESIYQEGLYVTLSRKEFDLKRLRKHLTAILDSFKQDLEGHESREALVPLARLSESFLEMEKLGVPPNYIARLKQEQSVIRKSIMRIYHIQRINFLPSAQILAQTIVILIISLLIFTKIEPFFDGIILMAFVSYIFIFLLRVLRVIDKPFRVDEYSMDDVSLFLLRETSERMKPTTKAEGA